MFTDILDAIEIATENDGDVLRAFQLARAKGIAKFMKFSGISQAEAAKAIGVSSTGIQKMISEPASLTKHLDALTDMLSLPKGSISSPLALSRFAKKNELYVNALDAVTSYTAAKYLPTGRMPTDYVINEVNRYLSDNYKTQCARLVAYFSAPNQSDTLGEKDITALEESVEVPAGSIQNPAEFAATKTKVSKLSLAVRKKIGANVSRILSERKLSESDIAIKAGVALVSVSNLLAKPHSCTLALLVALASALEIEPHKLMQDHVESEVEEPLQRQLFEDLPRVSRDFIWAYVTAVRDQHEGLPTPKANAVLLATPLIKHGVDVLTAYSSQGSDEDNPRNLGELVNQIAATLRVGL